MNEEMRDVVERAANLQKWLNQNGYGKPQSYKVCIVCSQVFNLTDPADNAYDINVHLRMNPSHLVVTR